MWFQCTWTPSVHFCPPKLSARKISWAIQVLQKMRSFLSNIVHQYSQCEMNAQLCLYTDYIGYVHDSKQALLCSYWIKMTVNHSILPNETSMGQDAIWYGVVAYIDFVYVYIGCEHAYQCYPHIRYQKQVTKWHGPN